MTAAIELIIITTPFWLAMVGFILDHEK